MFLGHFCPKVVRRKYPIFKYDAFIILWEDSYEKQKDSILKTIKDNSLDVLKVLTNKKGGILKIQYGSIDNCPELDELLNEGIRIPRNPKNEICMTPNAPIEGVLYYLIQKFISLVFDKEYVRINTSDIYNDWFRSYEIKSDRVRESLQYMVRLSLTEKERSNQFIFRRKHIKDSLDLISKLADHDLKDLLKISEIRPLDYYLDKKE